MTMFQDPSGPRVGAAAFAAAGAAAAPTILFGAWAVIAFPVGFAVAGTHVLLFGLPAYLLLRRRMRVDWAQAMIAGFLVGAVPVNLWSLIAGSGAISPYILWSFVPGVLGMLGGMAFRAVIGPPVQRTEERETAAIFR
jgi:hypothetical protein